MTQTLAATGGATHLECTRCGARHESEELHRLSTCCQKPLYPRYDLDAIGRTLSREDLAGRSADLWRYAELLPVRDPANAVRLGEDEVRGFVREAVAAGANDVGAVMKAVMPRVKGLFEGKELNRIVREELA